MRKHFVDLKAPGLSLNSHIKALVNYSLVSGFICWTVHSDRVLWIRVQIRLIDARVIVMQKIQNSWAVQFSCWYYFYIMHVPMSNLNKWMNGSNMEMFVNVTLNFEFSIHVYGVYKGWGGWKMNLVKKSGYWTIEYSFNFFMAFLFHNFELFSCYAVNSPIEAWLV